MLCVFCRNVSKLFKSERNDFGQGLVWASRERLDESAKRCELCAVFSELLPGEEHHEQRVPVVQRVIEREIHMLAWQKLSEDGRFYNVEIEFTRHTHTPSPLTLAKVTICNKPGQLPICSKDNKAVQKNCQHRVTSASSLDGNSEFILQRLHECIHHHHMCKKRLLKPQRSRLPKRVLDVCGEGSRVQLIETSGRCDWYVALSHRWGALDSLKPQILAFQDEPQVGLYPEDLPKTFRDAVHFTRQIGVRFLWIDSFCIIQDNGVDWKEQAPKMASVYQGALCTISAAASHDSGGGLYGWEQGKQCVHFEHDNRKLMAYCHADYKAIEKSPLNTRAWVLQEWILSPRVVHFTTDGVLWECISHVASQNHDFDFYFTHIQDESYSNEEETIFPVMARAAVAGSFHTWQSLYQIWERLVEDYTSRQLTFLTDKFAALAGLTTAFKQQLQDIPHVGLWRADFHLGLLWSVESYSSIDTLYLQHTRYKTPEWKAALPGIPSWSWASINGPIYYNVRRGARFVNDLQLNDVQVQWENGVRNYQTRGGRISAKGILRRFHVTYRGAHDCDLCFDRQPGRPSEIKQAVSPLFSTLSWVPGDLVIALEHTTGLDGEARNLNPQFLHREALLSVPPVVGEYREFIHNFDLTSVENGVGKPLDFLHGRGSLDRPMIPTKGSPNCYLYGLLVATELRPDGDYGGGVIPYANHVLFVERTAVQGEFQRIGIGIFWARHGYFERIEPQHLVIC